MAGLWRIGLVDSCGIWPRVRAACRFVRTDAGIAQADPTEDASGHGTRMAKIITSGVAEVALTLAQALDHNGRASADAVAAGIDWCLEHDVDLLHLSLGLRTDRASLAGAVRRAIDAGCVLVAAAPARGVLPYPAAYEGVLRGTGDARCEPGLISRLDDWTFGGCVTAPGTTGGGASVGAAGVTAALIAATGPCPTSEAIAVLDRIARWHGRESRRPAR